MNNTFLNNSETPPEVDNIFEKTYENSDYFTSISKSVVEAYTTDLDNLMLSIRHECVETNPDDDILERYILELSNSLYFLGSSLETVGIKDDVTRMAAKEAYNNSYLENCVNTEGSKKPTVAELQVNAENKSKYETVVNSIYNRVYKQIKYKIDAAYEMLNSLRKIITKRMQENQLSGFRTNDSLVLGKDMVD